MGLRNPSGSSAASRYPHRRNASNTRSRSTHAASFAAGADPLAERLLALADFVGRSASSVVRCAIGLTFREPPQRDSPILNSATERNFSPDSNPRETPGKSIWALLSRV